MGPAVPGIMRAQTNSVTLDEFPPSSLYLSEFVGPTAAAAIPRG